MSGGLMQIVAQGAQDRYLTKDPEITFFKSMHRRHTNFAIESIEQTINGSVKSGNKVSATISRNGDLVHQVWLEVTIPRSVSGTAMVPAQGNTAASGDPDNSTPGSQEVLPVVSETDIYSMLEWITVEIGGTQVDRHYGQWMKTHDNLTTTTSNKDVLDKLTSAAGSNRTKLYDASDGDKPYYAAKKLRVPLSFWFCKDAGQALPLIALQYHEVKVNVNFSRFLPAGSEATLFVDYIYLDTDERQRFARSSHEYLIEQVQTTGLETIENNASVGQALSETKSNKIRLNFNHPVKELVWALYSDQESPTRAPSALQGALLQLNGHDRFSHRDADYFGLVQQHQYHTGMDNGAFVYSFALEPEKLQPSGTCNFSRIDNATLVLDVAQDVAGADDDKATTAYVWAVNYNVLRIKNGMGGLAYSN